MGSRYGGLKQIDPMGPSGETILDYSVFDAIRKAMNGREKFFRENLKLGVFKSIETIAARYPGLYTK